MTEKFKRGEKHGAFKGGQIFLKRSKVSPLEVLLYLKHFSSNINYAK